MIRLPLYLLALTLTLAAQLAAPAPTRAQTATAATVDAKQLLADLSVLAADSMEGRRTGTPGNAKARSYIIRRFQAAGVKPLDASFEEPFTFSGRGGGAPSNGVNVVGMIRGTKQPDRYIVVSAHYDHLGVRDGDVFNGADDNASGTAALFAVAEYFRLHAPSHSLLLVAFDAEESGLRGARAFVEKPPVAKDAILADINMDMVSRNAAGELWVAGTYHYPQLLPLVEKLAATAPVELKIGHDRPGLPPGDDWTGSSDHGPFHSAGIPFLYFGVEDHADYHKASDEFDTITPEFYVHAIETVIGAVRAVDANPRARTATPAKQ
jgi:Zn-dependent M28 family amino/carboxypeptidase